MDCRNPDCCTTIADRHPTGFCSTCEETIIDPLRKKGLPQIDHFLKLEAEFVAWCEANGQPHPHS